MTTPKPIVAMPVRIQARNVRSLARWSRTRESSSERLGAMFSRFAIDDAIDPPASRSRNQERLADHLLACKHFFGKQAISVQYESNGFLQVAAGFLERPGLRI